MPRRGLRRFAVLAAMAAAFAFSAGAGRAEAQVPAGTLPGSGGAAAAPAEGGPARTDTGLSGAGVAGGVAGAGVGMQAVAARALARGEVLTAQDVRYVAAEEGAEAGEAPVSLIGWTTRRVIDEGEVLREPAVSPPDLVRAGDTVQAVYRGRSIVLRVTGTAAGSAAMGERVLVRVDARRRLEGVVIGPALVELDMNESR